MMSLARFARNAGVDRHESRFLARISSSGCCDKASTLQLYVAGRAFDGIAARVYDHKPVAPAGAAGGVTGVVWTRGGLMRAFHLRALVVGALLALLVPATGALASGSRVVVSHHLLKPISTAGRR